MESSMVSASIPSSPASSVPPSIGSKKFWFSCSEFDKFSSLHGSSGCPEQQLDGDDNKEACVPFCCGSIYII